MLLTVGEESAVLTVLPASRMCTIEGSELGCFMSRGRLEVCVVESQAIPMLSRSVDGTSCSQCRTFDCRGVVLPSVRSVVAMSSRLSYAD